MTATPPGDFPESSPTASPTAFPTASPTASPGVLTRGTLVIDTEACKGCELCIDACPPNVLVMTEQLANTRGYRYPQLLAGCIACQACTAICPDFVFQVYRYDEPVVL